jgi:hypothetical protein
MQAPLVSKEISAHFIRVNEKIPSVNWGLIGTIQLLLVILLGWSNCIAKLSHLRCLVEIYP